jgi:dTDP-4-dehydrorhamnose reductase
MKKKKIVISGGDGRFAKVLKLNNNKLNIFYPNKKKLNILKINSIENYLKKIKPKYLIHAAALSRPMSIHDKNISKSIDLNIIGTCNIVKVCSNLKIKLIYFSTGYVYEGKKGNYKENDPLLPINNYAWSKLGGECAVTMYKNSLILRITMCEKPFIHKSAFYDIKSNFIFHDEVAKIIPKILNKKGILNIGGKIQSIYSFAKKDNPKVKKISGKKLFPKNPSMNVGRLNKLLNIK